MNKQQTPARYIMVGGFLGAGKSTSILKLAKYLDDQGLRVGLITNDQGHRLVDTLNVRSHGFAVEEIPGGCFCCRFNSLMEAAEQLTEQTRPDVFIAEPVGSCTDLVASVSYPLRRIYGDRFTVSPLSVIVDPLRAMRVLGLTDAQGFSEKVTYIYLKQLEEAATIVINKTDLLEASQLQLLKTALAERFPGRDILCFSAREGTGMDEWFKRMSQLEQPSGQTMDVDYGIYAEGEALLGWLNATIELKADHLLDGDELLGQLARDVQKRLAAENAEIAHFKMTLSPYDQSGELAVLSLVGSQYQPEFTQNLSDPLDRGQLIVNLRAEGAPELLASCLKAALAEVTTSHSGLILDLDHLEHFRPGEPKPIYRMNNDTETPQLQPMGG